MNAQVALDIDDRSNQLKLVKISADYVRVQMSRSIASVRRPYECGHAYLQLQETAHFHGHVHQMAWECKLWGNQLERAVILHLVFLICP